MPEFYELKKEDYDEFELKKQKPRSLSLVRILKLLLNSIALTVGFVLCIFTLQYVFLVLQMFSFFPYAILLEFGLYSAIITMFICLFAAVGYTIYDYYQYFAFEKKWLLIVDVLLYWLLLPNPAVFWFSLNVLPLILIGVTLYLLQRTISKQLGSYRDARLFSIITFVITTICSLLLFTF